VTSSINYLAEIEQLRAQLAEKEAQLQSQSARIDVLEEVVVMINFFCKDFKRLFLTHYIFDAG